MKGRKTKTPEVNSPRSPREQVIEALLLQARTLRKASNAFIAEEAARWEQEFESQLGKVGHNSNPVAKAT